MTAKAITRIGFYLLVGSLLAAEAPRASLAEDAASQSGTTTPVPGNDSADHAAGTGDTVSKKTDGGSAKPESAKPDVTSPVGGQETGGKSEGAHVNVPVNDSSRAGQAHNSGAVDTHIAPPSRHNDNRLSAVNPRSKFKVVGAGSRLRSTVGHLNTGHVTRNSIGLAVPSQPGKLDRDSKPAPPAAPPAVSATGAKAGEISPAVKTAPVEHPIAAHPNVSAPVAINGSAIGGNPNIRRSFGPASIGGQTRAVAGINGSTIVRRPH
jgi:hypothetical protein